MFVYMYMSLYICDHAPEFFLSIIDGVQARCLDTAKFTAETALRDLSLAPLGDILLCWESFIASRWVLLLFGWLPFSHPQPDRGFQETIGINTQHEPQFQDRID